MDPSSTSPPSAIAAQSPTLAGPAGASLSSLSAAAAAAQQQQQQQQQAATGAVGAQSQSAGSGVRQPKRASQTCVTCRARKVRCDGRRETCSNCERLNFTCSYEDSGAPVAGLGFVEVVGSDGVATYAVPRRRVRQACHNCHLRKARCSGGLPKCDRCRAQGIECVYRPGKRSSRTSATMGGAGGGGSGSGPPFDPGEGPSGQSGRDDHMSDHSRSISLERIEPPGAGTATGTASPSNFGPDHPVSYISDEVLESVAVRTFNNFFKYVQHIPMFGFLHRASLMQRYHAGLVDRALLLALVGITSLLTDLGGPTMRDLGERCIAEAEALVLKDLEKPSTLRLQALVIVIKHRILSRRLSSAFMLYAIASRFASALRLNHENPQLCFLARESRRRLMWSVYMIDTGLASSNADFSLWAYRPEAITIQLPCNERNFEYDLPETTEPLEQPLPGPDGTLPPLPDDIGFLALHVRIHMIRSRIQQFTKRLSAQATPADLDTLPARCAELEAQLDAFATRLPASFRWSEANVRLRTYSPRLCVFLMTHVWWEQCHCDLYRVALPGLRGALPQALVAQVDARHPGFARHCRRRAFDHARAMADMFGLLLTLDSGVPVTDLDLPVCLYQCARMLYYALQTSGAAGGGAGVGAGAGAGAGAAIGPDDPAITAESVTELAGVCMKVLKQSITTPAALAIRADLEKLMANGVAAESSTPRSRASSPDMAAEMEMDDESPTTAALSRHQSGFADDEVTTNALTTTTTRSTTAPSTPAADAAAGRMALYPALAPKPPGPLQAASASAHPPLPLPSSPMEEFSSPQAMHHMPAGAGAGAGSSSRYPEPPTTGGAAAAAEDRSVAMSNGTAASHPSNAFEGALDVFDYGMEHFGVDSSAMPWFSGDWLSGGEDFGAVPPPLPLGQQQQQQQQQRGGQGQPPPGGPPGGLIE